MGTSFGGSDRLGLLSVRPKAQAMNRPERQAPPQETTLAVVRTLVALCRSAGLEDVEIMERVQHELREELDEQRRADDRLTASNRPALRPRKPRGIQLWARGS